MQPTTGERESRGGSGSSLLPNSRGTKCADGNWRGLYSFGIFSVAIEIVDVARSRLSATATDDHARTVRSKRQEPHQSATGGAPYLDNTSRSPQAPARLAP
jgi:hypothetical protein